MAYSNSFGQFCLRRAFLFCVAAAFLSLAGISLADGWSSSRYINNPICIADHDQSGYAVADGTGGAFYVWEDERGGGEAVYSQRVNADGIPQWAVNGAFVDYGFFPSVVPDGAGGAIFVWTTADNDDEPGEQHGLKAQRFDSDGVPQWTIGGIVVSANEASNNGPASIIPDGAGGAVIAWRKPGSNGNIFAQWIDVSGALPWGTSGVAVTAVGGVKRNPEIINDGQSGSIIAWADSRNGTNFDIYAQRLNASGDDVWTTNGVVVCGATRDQIDVRLVTDEAAGAIITWTDSRENTSSSDVYAQRISNSGAPQWTADGIGVATSNTFYEFTPRPVPDGAGGIIIAYQSFFVVPIVYIFNINAQHLDSTGTKLWTPEVTLTRLYGSNPDHVQIVEDGSGGAIFGWNDYRNNNDVNVYAQRINSSGAFVWPGSSITVCAEKGFRSTPTLISDGSGGSIFTWSDRRNGPFFDLYSDRVLSTGELSPADTVTWFLN